MLTYTSMADFSYSSPVKTKTKPTTIRRRRLLLVAPAVFLIFVFLYIVGYKASIRTRELKTYITQTNKTVVKSNKVALKLKKQLKNPSVRVKASRGTDLLDMVKDCTNMSDYAEHMVVPERFLQIQSYFIMTMKLRNKGMILYNQSISGKDSEKVKEKKINEALRYFDFSDLAYQTFEEELKNVIKGEKLDIKIVKSKFTNDKLLKKTKIKAVKPKVKSEDAGDISIDDVATAPLRISINTNTQVRVLPLTDSIDVRIRVKNTGKVDLKNIPVEVELLTDSNAKGERKQGAIDEVSTGGIAKITLHGFSPKEGSLNKFKITVGPLPGEQNISDNSYEYKFILRDTSSPNQNQTQNGVSQTSTNQ